MKLRCVYIFFNDGHFVFIPQNVDGSFAQAWTKAAPFKANTEDLKKELAERGIKSPVRFAGLEIIPPLSAWK